MKKLFVWDFHGTLERGNYKAVWKISNLILKKFGFRQRLTQKKCQRLYGRKWFEYFKYLLPEESESTHFQLQEDCFLYSDAHPEIIGKYIKATPYSHLVLKTIQKSHNQILISNTKPESLKIFIKSVGVGKFFGDHNCFAVDGHGSRNRLRNKRIILKNYLKKHDFDQLVVIGDSAKDIKLASVFSKSVSYLFAHKGQKFRKCEANYKIHDLRYVLQEL